MNNQSQVQKQRISRSGLRMIGLSLGVLSIGFAIAYGGYLLSLTKKTPSPSPSPTPSPTISISPSPTRNN